MVEFSFETIAFMAFGLFAFAWIVRLGFNVRHTVRHHSDAIHDRLDDMEESLLGVMKNVDGLEVDLNDKADHAYVQKRIDGLLDLIQGQKSGKRK